MRFQSKIDSWLLVLLIIAIAGQVAAIVAVVASSSSGFETAIVIAITVPGISLIVSILLRTHYTIFDGELRIVSGPFFWTISISDITDIVPSKNILSSPALSLDRLKITYGSNKKVLISPEDTDGFLRAISERTV